LFEECGKHADLIISCVLSDFFADSTTKDEAVKLIGVVTDVFADGMEGALI
jgi:hypothetical protein